MNLEQWTELRQLDEELVAKLDVREYQKGGKSWIEIPYFKDGKKVNAKHRCLDEKAFFQEADGEKVFYNHDILFDETLEHLPIVITEGEVDAWTFMQCGYIRTISVPEGAPNEIINGDSKKYSYLKSYIPILKKAPCVILAVDSDKNGNNLLHDLSMRIGRGKCQWIKYPKDCKDINDAMVKYGRNGVVKSYETRQPLSMDGVYRVTKLPPVAEAKVFSSGMQGLKDKFKIRFGDFSVITGIPSMGKTTFVNDLICNLVLNNSLSVCFASLEQHPSLDHVRNLRAWYKGKYPDANDYQADLWIDKYFSFIYPSDEQQLNDELDLDWFLKHAEYAVEAMGAKVVVLDPWNELEHVPYSDQSLTEYVGMAIRKIKRFAKIMNVHVMVVAHPTKQQKNKDGEFQIPTLYDISDSANWFNKPELGAIVHRDENGDTIFKIAKSRYWDILGKPDVVKYRFDEIKKSFYEIL
jgi:twinkle protein